jgi:hypothetical protein
MHSKEISVSAQKCIAKKNPVKIWLVKSIPKREPKFQSRLILEGEGRSISTEFPILKIILFLRRIIKNWCELGI